MARVKEQMFALKMLEPDDDDNDLDDTDVLTPEEIVTYEPEPELGGES